MVNTTIVVLIVYLLMIFGIAWYFSRRESLEAYFVNKKKTGIWLLTLSSVSTMIGAGATVAIVSETYNTGISYGLAIPIALVSGAIVLSIVAKKVKEFGTEHDAYTLVDLFEKRFDTKNKILVLFLQLFLQIIWMGVQAIAMASLASVLTGIDYNTALLLAAGITILYTAIGGMKIDLITDFVQFWIILIVFIIMGIIGYNQIGSFSNLFSSVPAGHLNIFAFGGAVWFFGVILLSGFVSLGNSGHWQRIISSKNKYIASNSYILTIPFLLLMGLLIVFFGLLASVFLTGINQDLALFELMKVMLPPSLLGVGFAAILAVVMSSVDTTLIAGSTIIYRSMFKKHSFDNKKELFYARLITALFGVVGFSLAFIIPNIVTLSLFAAYLAVVLSIPVIFALFSKKLSANASFFAISIATLLLLIGFPIIGPNSFVPPIAASLLILIFYDKIFKKNTSILE